MRQSSKITEMLKKMQNTKKHKTNKKLVTHFLVDAQIRHTNTEPFLYRSFYDFTRIHLFHTNNNTKIYRYRYKYCLVW